MKLSNIFIYPIKGCSGISVDSAILNGRGIEYDRRWMLVDDQGLFISQRSHPKMALIEQAIDGDQLFISFEDQTHQIPLNPNYQQSETVTVWGDQINGFLADDNDHQWFSSVLGTPVRLVAMKAESVRPVSQKYAVSDDDEVSFADGYPFLIIGEAALDKLNQQLSEDSYMLIDRFRPNFVFSGGMAHEEDTWQEFSIGDSRFAGVKPCARCQVITIDQQTAEKGAEPLKTLAGYRKLNNKILFGQNAILLEGEYVSKGDRIIVHKTKEALLPLP